MVENERFYEQNLKYTYECAFAKQRYNFLSDDDKNLISRYIMELQAITHISAVSANKVGYMLIQWRRLLKRPWRDINIDDVYADIAAL